VGGVNIAQEESEMFLITYFRIKRILVRQLSDFLPSDIVQRGYLDVLPWRRCLFRSIYLSEEQRASMITTWRTRAEIAETSGLYEQSRSYGALADIIADLFREPDLYGVIINTLDGVYYVLIDMKSRAIVHLLKRTEGLLGPSTPTKRLGFNQPRGSE